MISQCPHCNQELNLSGTQVDKIKGALASLKPGKFLKVGCPHCRKSIELDSDGKMSAGPANAAAGNKEAVQEAAPEETKDKAAPYIPKPINPPPDPPKPPDTDWLTTGDFADAEVIEDVNKVMVLANDEAIKRKVIDAFTKRGYKPVVAESAHDAMEKMRFTSYAAVVYHSPFEGGKIETSTFHEHMCSMAMVHRRYIYYVLIGPEFKTLYDLQALAFSANLVINDVDIEQLEVILKKGFSDYDMIFGPLLNALKEYGKK